MKKYLLFGFCVGMVILFVSACVHCPSPSKDTYFFTVTPSGILPFLIEKGEFNKSEEERGYKIFDSEEELDEYLRSLYRSELGEDI